MENKHHGVFLFIVLVIAGTVGLIIGVANSNNTSITGNVVQESRQPTCRDSDGGQITYLRGTVITTDSLGNVDTYKDFCRNYNSNTLVEYTCNGADVTSIDIYCLHGCTSGACNVE